MPADPQPFDPLEGWPLGFTGIVDGPFDLFDLPATGSQNLTGTVAGTTTTAGTVVGRKGALGTVAGSTATAGTVVGRKGATGSVSGTTTTSGTGVGSKGATGSVSGTTTTAGTVSGSKGATGSISGATVTAGTVVGSGGDQPAPATEFPGFTYPRRSGQEPEKKHRPVIHRPGAAHGRTRTRGQCRGTGAPNDDDAITLLLVL